MEEKKDWRDFVFDPKSKPNYKTREKLKELQTDDIEKILEYAHDEMVRREVVERIKQLAAVIE